MRGYMLRIKKLRNELLYSTEIYDILKELGGKARRQWKISSLVIEVDIE